MSGFSSDKHREILHLESRRKIYALVKHYSGCNFHELQRRSTLSSSTLQYHLHYLTRRGLISIQKDGNKVRYFSQSLGVQDKRLLGLLRQETVRHLLLFLLNHLKAQQKEIAAFLQLSPSTVSWYLKRLIDQHIIEACTTQKAISYKLLISSEQILALLLTYKGSFFDQLVDKTIEMWEFQ